MANHDAAIQEYWKNQEAEGNTKNDAQRFIPGNDFYQTHLEEIAASHPYSDIYEINAKEHYLIIDLLDDVGLYKITIEKLD